MTSPLARGLFHKAIVQSGYLVSNPELTRSRRDPFEFPHPAPIKPC
jgi:carboxylesterase type B